MSRWVWRMIAVLILLIFFAMMMNLQRRLVDIQRERGTRPVPATTT